jgi:anti-sigma factor RsiW
MTRHDAFREQLALRLYGELSPTEEAALDAHVAGCTDCRAFAHELTLSLGAVVPDAGLVAAHADEMPADWVARLDRVTGTRPPGPGPVRALATFATGLAAGILIALLARGTTSLGTAGTPSQAPLGATVRFATNAPSAGASEAALELDAPPPLSLGRAFAGMPRSR